jgi:predicted transcriptional regulator
MENKALILDLLEWIAARPRKYEDVMDAWRTSCPRLTIWEDAVDAGYVQTQSGTGTQNMVAITDHGKEFLDANHRIHA